MDIVQSSLALFQPPLMDNCIKRETWIEFGTVSSISPDSVLEFTVPGTSMDYLDLKKNKIMY